MDDIVPIAVGFIWLIILYGVLIYLFIDYLNVIEEEEDEKEERRRNRL